MKIRLLTYTLISVSLLIGCETLPSESDEYGTGDLSLTITSSDVQTKSAKDGDVMNNLYLCLVRDGNEVMSINSVDEGDDSAENFVVISSDGTTATARFSEITRGDYTLYAVANKPSSVSMDFTSEADFQAIVLSNIVNSQPDYSDTDGMPLSLVKTFSVGPGANSVNAELLRVCGGIRLSVLNQIKDRNVFIESIGFDDKNPISGYLFHREDHEVPAGRTSFVRYSMGESPFAITPSGDEGSGIIDQYIYESGSMNPFKLVINGAIYPEAVTTPPIVDGAEETKMVYNPAAPLTSFNTTDQFLIQSLQSPQIYLYAQSNTTVVGKQMTEEELSAALENPAEAENYLWTFSGTGTTSIRSVGRGTYITTPQSNSTAVSLSNTSTTFTYSNQMFYFSYGSWTTYYKYLRNNSGTFSAYRTTSSNPSGNQYRWQFYKVTEQTIPAGKRLSDYEKRFDWTISELTYADQYGIPVPLESVCRNEILDIKVNVFYNDVLGKVYYEVTAWDKIENDTTFD